MMRAMLRTLVVCLALVASALDAQAQQRVGPKYLYPDPAVTPGVVNPDITQANIGETICNPNWSTKTIRPPATCTNKLKTHQLVVLEFKDKVPSHYEEDHFISLGVGWASSRPQEPVAGTMGNARDTADIARAVPFTPRRGEVEGCCRERAA